MTSSKDIWCMKVYSLMSCNFSLVGTLGGGIREWEAVCPGY